MEDELKVEKKNLIGRETGRILPGSSFLLSLFSLSFLLLCALFRFSLFSAVIRVIKPSKLVHGLTNVVWASK